MLYRLSFVVLLAILIAGLIGAAPARAQEDDPASLNFDEPQIVPLAPGTTVTRSFSVLAGDRFDLRVIALAPMAYSVTLVDPLMGLAPLTVDSAGSATLTVDPVAFSGRYTLLLQPGDTGGDVVLQLTGAPTLPDPLTFNAITPVSLIDQPQRYRLEAQPGFLETLLTITRLPAPDALEPVALPRVVLVDAESGRVVAALDSDSLPGAALRLPGDAPYFLAIEPGGAPADVEIRWEGATSAPSAGGQAPGGAVTGATPTFTPFPSVTPDGTITVTPTGTTTVTPTVTGTLTATYTPDPNATATAIPSPTAPGQGDETVTATYTPSDTPTQPAHTLTYTPSYTPTDANGNQLAPPAFTPTYTYTPTIEALADLAAPTFTPTFTLSPTLPPTATPAFTPTLDAPVAPPDANYSMSIPLDSTVSVTDFVSYPSGDTQDRVNWNISGMNPNSGQSGGRARLIITVSCFGTGTQHITFFIGGQNYVCGQTIVDREVTYDSRTGSVQITAAGGTGTYVQWVVIGTATRIN